MNGRMYLVPLGLLMASWSWADVAVPGVALQTVRDGVVKIDYTLADDSPAIVTLDIEAKDETGEWASIGGESIRSFSADSAVFRQVSGTNEY